MRQNFEENKKLFEIIILYPRFVKKHLPLLPFKKLYLQQQYKYKTFTEFFFNARILQLTESLSIDIPLGRLYFLSDNTVKSYPTSEEYQKKYG